MVAATIEPRHDMVDHDAFCRATLNASVTVAAQNEIVQSTV